MHFDSMIERLQEFGRFRERDDPKDMFGTTSFGFFYVHQSCLTAIIFRKMESYWLLETAACARVGLRPSEDLFRRVSQWATTSGIVSCNLVEDGHGQAAALVSGRVSVDALEDGHAGIKYVAHLIDATDSITRHLGGDLERFGGRYLEEQGTSLGEIADQVHAWWSVQDRAILTQVMA